MQKGDRVLYEALTTYVRVSYGVRVVYKVLAALSFRHALQCRTGKKSSSRFNHRYLPILPNSFIHHQRARFGKMDRRKEQY